MRNLKGSLQEGDVCGGLGWGTGGGGGWEALALVLLRAEPMMHIGVSPEILLEPWT